MWLLRKQQFKLLKAFPRKQLFLAGGVGSRALAGLYALAEPDLLCVLRGLVVPGTQRKISHARAGGSPARARLSCQTGRQNLLGSLRCLGSYWFSFRFG